MAGKEDRIVLIVLGLSVGVGFGETSLAGLHSPSDATIYFKRAKTQDVFY